MAAVAAHKGIKPQRLAVDIERISQTGSTWQTRFGVRVDFGSGLSSREQAILFNSARQCEVHKLLTGEMVFDYTQAESTIRPSTQ